MEAAVSWVIGVVAAAGIAVAVPWHPFVSDQAAIAIADWCNHR